MLKNQNYEGSLQKTQWGIYSMGRRVWWLDNSGSQSSERRKWIPEQSQIRCGGTRSRHSMDAIFPCKNKNSQDTNKNLRKFLEPSEKPKVRYTDNSWGFGKSCEELSWNHRTSTPYRSETNGIAERAIRRVKEGTSAVLFQSGLGDKWWSDSMECHCHLRNVQDLLADGKTPYERRFGWIS